MKTVLLLWLLFSIPAALFVWALCHVEKGRGDDEQ